MYIVNPTSNVRQKYRDCINVSRPIPLRAGQLYAVEALMKDAERGSDGSLAINLETQTVTCTDGRVFSFEIDPFLKRCLLEGLDDIALTLQKEDKIAAFEARFARSGMDDVGAGAEGYRGFVCRQYDLCTP